MTFFRPLYVACRTLIQLRLQQSNVEGQTNAFICAKQIDLFTHKLHAVQHKEREKELYRA